VAFDWRGPKGDHPDIYIKLVGAGGEPLRLTTNPAGGSCPAWSPDGRSIAFLRFLSAGGAAILLIPALGGPEREIAQISPSYYADRSVAWAPDGKSLTVSHRASPADPYALYLISIDNGNMRRLTSPPPRFVGDDGPALSPDGGSLAFVRIVDGSVSDLYVLGLSGLTPKGDPRRVTFGNLETTSAAWTPDGRELVFSSGFLHHDLWRIEANNVGKPRRLAAAGETGSQPAISHRTHRLAYSRDLRDTNIWQIEMRGGASPASGPRSLIASTRTEFFPAFSPDGTRIAFTSSRSGTMEVWVCDADGSHAEALTDLGGAAASSPHWSPDGRRIAFDSTLGGQWDIYVVGATGGRLQRLTTDPANDGNPSWSHDGQWIYFDSTRAGQAQVWKMPQHGAEPVQITRNGGIGPIESPDGKFVYFAKSLAGSSLWRIPAAGGKETKVLDSSALWNFAVTKTGLYFVPVESHSIQFLELATGKVTRVAKSEQKIGFGLSVSPDGRSLLYAQLDREGGDLMLVENFR
jgi:Tol biopolymer transport system component